MRGQLANGSEAVSDINNIFEDIFELPANLQPGNAFQGSLAAGTASLASIRASVADSQQSTNSINSAYVNELGRGVDPTGLSIDQGAEASGATTLNIIHVFIANSAEATNDINVMWQGILGRAQSASGLAAVEGTIAAGGISMAGYHLSVATSAEASADVGREYLDVLNRSVDGVGLGAAQNFFAGGGTMPQVQSSLAYSGEAVADIQNTAIRILGHAFSTTTAWSAAMANGSFSLLGLTSQIATSAEAAGDITVAYSAASAEPIDGGTMAAVQASLAAGGTIAGAASVMADSANVQNDIAGVFDQEQGADPSAGQLAVATTDIVSTVQAQAPTWSNFAAVFNNAFHTFINAFFPPASAEPIITTQEANVAQDKAYLANPNVLAFIHTTSAAENGGTWSTNNYYVVHGNVPNSTSLATFPNTLYSAGAYQIERTLYDELSQKLGLTDFYGPTQDLMSVDRLAQQGAIADLLSGNLAGAIAIASRTWAAVPISSTQDHSFFTYRSGPHLNQLQPSMPYSTFVSTFHSLGGTLR